MLGGISVFIAALALLISYASYRTAHRRGIQPILVFGHGGRDAANVSIWYVHNVGHGPALNVTIAGGDTELHWDQDRATRFPAIGLDERFGLSWVGKTGALLAQYSDAEGRPYTTVCVNVRNDIQRGSRYPDLTARRGSWQLSKQDLRLNHVDA